MDERDRFNGGGGGNAEAGISVPRTAGTVMVIRLLWSLLFGYLRTRLAGIRRNAQGVRVE